MNNLDTIHSNKILTNSGNLKKTSNQIRQINYYILVILLPFFLFVCQLNVHVVVFYFK